VPSTRPGAACHARRPRRAGRLIQIKVFCARPGQLSLAGIFGTCRHTPSLKAAPSPGGLPLCPGRRAWRPDHPIVTRGATGYQARMPGPRPRGERAMSVAERSAAYRARRKAELEAAGKAPVVRIRFRPNRSTASCGLTATGPRAVGKRSVGPTGRYGKSGGLAACPVSGVDNTLRRAWLGWCSAGFKRVREP